MTMKEKQVYEKLSMGPGSDYQLEMYDGESQHPFKPVQIWSLLNELREL